MRRLFNENNLWEKLTSGELTAVILESRNAPESAEQPPGTLSQSISYRDADGNEIARVHQYLRTDGSLGGSGMPDPKRVFVDDVLYRLVKKNQNEPEANDDPAPSQAGDT